MPIAFCGAEIFKNLNAAEKNLIDFFFLGRLRRKV